MIMGSCPHCDNFVSKPIDNLPLPVFSRELCLNCNKYY